LGGEADVKISPGRGGLPRRTREGHQSKGGFERRAKRPGGGREEGCREGVLHSRGLIRSRKHASLNGVQRTSKRSGAEGDHSRKGPHKRLLCLKGKRACDQMLKTRKRHRNRLLTAFGRQALRSPNPTAIANEGVNCPCSDKNDVRSLAAKKDEEEETPNLTSES